MQMRNRQQAMTHFLSFVLFIDVIFHLRFVTPHFSRGQFEKDFYAANLAQCERHFPKSLESLILPKGKLSRELSASVRRHRKLQLLSRPSNCEITPRPTQQTQGTGVLSLSSRASSATAVLLREIRISRCRQTVVSYNTPHDGPVYNCHDCCRHARLSPLFFPSTRFARSLFQLSLSFSAVTGIIPFSAWAI